MRYLALILTLFTSVAFGQGQTRYLHTFYHHATVGTTAQDAITAVSVERDLRGWRVCHDGGSANAYLAISTGVDPDVDGVRIAAGECFACLGCSYKTLVDLNVKGSAATTGYSVFQQR